MEPQYWQQSTGNVNARSADIVKRVSQVPRNDSGNCDDNNNTSQFVDGYEYLDECGNVTANFTRDQPLQNVIDSCGNSTVFTHRPELENITDECGNVTATFTDRELGSSKDTRGYISAKLTQNFENSLCGNATSNFTHANENCGDITADVTRDQELKYYTSSCENIQTYTHIGTELMNVDVCDNNDLLGNVTESDLLLSDVKSSGCISGELTPTTRSVDVHSHNNIAELTQLADDVNAETYHGSCGYAMNGYQRITDLDAIEDANANTLESSCFEARKSDCREERLSELSELTKDYDADYVDNNIESSCEYFSRENLNQSLTKDSDLTKNTNIVFKPHDGNRENNDLMELKPENNNINSILDTHASSNVSTDMACDYDRIMTSAVYQKATPLRVSDMHITQATDCDRTAHNLYIDCPGNIIDVASLRTRGTDDTNSSRISPSTYVDYARELDVSKMPVSSPYSADNERDTLSTDITAEHSVMLGNVKTLTSTSSTEPVRTECFKPVISPELVSRSAECHQNLDVTEGTVFEDDSLSNDLGIIRLMQDPNSETQVRSINVAEPNSTTSDIISATPVFTKNSDIFDTTNAPSKRVSTECCTDFVVSTSAVASNVTSPIYYTNHSTSTDLSVNKKNNDSVPDASKGRIVPTLAHIYSGDIPKGRSNSLYRDLDASLVQEHNDKCFKDSDASTDFVHRNDLSVSTALSCVGKSGEISTADVHRTSVDKQTRLSDADTEVFVEHNSLTDECLLDKQTETKYGLTYNSHQTYNAGSVDLTRDLTWSNQKMSRNESLSSTEQVNYACPQVHTKFINPDDASESTVDRDIVKQNLRVDETVMRDKCAKLTLNDEDVEGLFTHGCPKTDTNHHDNEHIRKNETETELPIPAYRRKHFKKHRPDAAEKPINKDLLLQTVQIPGVNMESESKQFKDKSTVDYLKLKLKHGGLMDHHKDVLVSDSDDSDIVQYHYIEDIPDNHHHDPKPKPQSSRFVDNADSGLGVAGLRDNLDNDLDTMDDGIQDCEADSRFLMPKRFQCSNCNYAYKDAFYIWDSLPYNMALAIEVEDRQPAGVPADVSTSSSYDSALISEAHGLITDMLAETNLPPQVISGLRAVNNLLKPPDNQNSGYKPRVSPLVSLTESPNYGSDTEDSPYTGERPTTLPKRLRRSLPPGLIRRMSTSTWTTTTSATGMPTVEMEPCRLRSSSFRQNRIPDNITPGSSPTASRSNSPSPSSPSTVTLSIPKARSFSVGPSSLVQPGSQKRQIRKSVCFVGQTEIPPEQKSSSPKHTDVVEDIKPALKETKEPHYSAPSKRFNITSDYESSDSPSSSDHSDNVATSDEFCMSPPKKIMNRIEASPLLNKQETAVKEPSPTPKSEPPQQEITPTEDITDSKPPPEPSQPPKTVDDTLLFEPSEVDKCELLDMKLLADWDYPIFDFADSYGSFMLSKLAYKVFAEVGLLETFRIPLAPFIRYFHALELGYRDIPYHNRIHAADVLHGVFYFTSQPVAGLQQVSHSHILNHHPSSTDSGFEKYDERQIVFKTTCADDSYGIMGGNLPALELMALYTAAAMHDYDHPGRTNAFLVTTYSPKAILYNDRSVLENHHAAAAWHLLMSNPKHNFLSGLDAAEFKRFRFIAIEAILATDLKRHFEILAEFNAKVNDDDAPGIDWSLESDRLLVSQMVIKLSDINGPAKRKDLHCNWTERISDEFYAQGKEESERGLPISPFMDRRNPQLAKLQESFINHLVAPLCNAMVTGGIVPGTWVDDDDDSEGGVLSDTDNNTGKDTDEDTDDQDMGSPDIKCKNVRKINCVLTKNMKDNHEMWVKHMQDEEKLKTLHEAAKAEQASQPSQPTSQPSQPASQPAEKQVTFAPPPDKSEMAPIKEESENSPKSSPLKTS